ncbi:MAG: Imidazole glycerol phosphate synthase subunit HisF [Alphaproteobacteria bacterium MarineAlpha9_Bin4]|nr:MAG: Imidazole glycerol phosphate synthase subunit HisF [Alphaproteobacteria bacterium MarineAlpha9_Bin4]|tara:strand:+ start:184 stop:933 length:750 start_codon:yes stop_codon:yes gene_type:complete
MHSIRIIARLDIKGDKVVKGINLEGIRKIGNPKEIALNYYTQGIDEIIYMDVVASLYERNTITKFIKDAASKIFVPLTVGGGIRSLNDIRNVLNNGADKVAINTAAIKNPNFIKEASNAIGSQSIVVSIEAKKHTNYWEAYYDNGREKSGLDVINWAQKAQELGAGELLITSVDKEGLEKGMDIDLLVAIRDKIKIPIIFSGGVGNIEHVNETAPYADAIAVASLFHYNKEKINEFKKKLIKKGIEVRI